MQVGGIGRKMNYAKAKICSKVGILEISKTAKIVREVVLLAFSQIGKLERHSKPL